MEELDSKMSTLIIKIFLTVGMLTGFVIGYNSDNWIYIFIITLIMLLFILFDILNIAEEKEINKIKEVIVKGNQIKVNGVWFINRDKFVEKFKKWASSGTRIIDEESVCKKLNELYVNLV